MQIELLPHRRIPTVGAAEENFGAEIAGFGGGERLRPLHAGGRVGAGTIGGVFGKPRTLFGGFFVPVVPTLGADVVAHPAFQIHHARIVAPGAAQEYVVHAGIGRQPAVGEHEALRAIGHGAAFGGHVARAAAVDLAMVEHRGGVAENEIDVAGDVAIDVILAAAGGVKRVLHSQKPAVAEHGAVGVYRNRHRLRAGAVGVFEGDILRLELVGVDIDGGAEEGAADVLG